MPTWLSENSRTQTVYQKKNVATVFHQFDVREVDPLFQAILALLPPGAYVGGGYLTALLTHKPPNDLDIWFESETARTATKTAVEALLATAPWASLEQHKAERGDFTEIKVSRQGKPPFLISLNGYYLFTGPEHVIDLFDFTATQLIMHGNDMWVGPTTLDDIANGRLVFHQFQAAITYRVPKYIRKGFTPTEDAMTAIALRNPALTPRIHTDLQTKLLADRAEPDTQIDRSAQVVIRPPGPPRAPPIHTPPTPPKNLS